MNRKKQKINKEEKYETELSEENVFIAYYSSHYIHGVCTSVAFVQLASR